MAKRSKPKTGLDKFVAEAKRRDPVHRELLDGLTPAQVDELGVMFGMSNLGQDWRDRPESVAEDDEMYEGFMEEIRHWQRRFRDRKERWGCHHDFPEMVAEAVRRCSRKPQRIYR